jgi:hypothetical protein
MPKVWTHQKSSVESIATQDRSMQPGEQLAAGPQLHQKGRDSPESLRITMVRWFITWWIDFMTQSSMVRFFPTHLAVTFHKKLVLFDRHASIHMGHGHWPTSIAPSPAWPDVWNPQFPRPLPSLWTCAARGSSGGHSDGAKLKLSVETSVPPIYPLVMTNIAMENHHF